MNSATNRAWIQWHNTLRTHDPIPILCTYHAVLNEFENPTFSLPINIYHLWPSKSRTAPAAQTNLEPAAIVAILGCSVVKEKCYRRLPPSHVPVRLENFFCLEEAYLVGRSEFCRGRSNKYCMEISNFWNIFSGEHFPYFYRTFIFCIQFYSVSVQNFFFF